MITISNRLISIKHFLFILLMFFACANVFAQEKFYCRVSEKNIAKNETLQIDYVIENAGSINDVNLPEFKSFSVVSGPNQSSETSMINGKTTASYSISFLVQPKSPGKFVIPAASARINNKTMTTNTVEVVVGNRTSKNSSGGNSMLQSLLPSMGIGLPQMDMPDLPDEDVYLKPGEDFNEKVKKDLLVVLQVNKTNCFIGEPIVATYKLCSRLKSESKVTKRPSLDGFSVYDMVDVQNASPTVENIGGKPYTVHVIRKVQLYPLQTGTFQLDPVELDNTVRFIRRGSSPSSSSKNPLQQMMDDYGNQTWEEHEVTIASKPATIVVKPLPENKPASFNGAVGKFTMEAKLSTTELHAEDDATLNITLNGEGNLPLINAPGVTFPMSFESFDPTVKENVDKTVSPIAGSKQFNFMFVPSDTGTFTIAPITFSYFDPAANSYKTISSEPLTVHVLKALHKKKKSKTAAPLQTNNSFVLKDWWYWMAGGIVLIGILLWVLFAKRKKQPSTGIKNEITEPPVVEKKKESAPIQPVPEVTETDMLEKSRKALQEGNSRLFFSTIQNTLWQEVSRKTGIAPGLLDKKTALKILEEKGASDVVRTELESLLNTCEMALYMPQSASDMQNVLYKATFVVNALKA